MFRIKKFYLLMLFILFKSVLWGQDKTNFTIDEKILGAELKKIIRTSRTITSYECFEYVKELSSYYYNGRGTGFEGYMKAAKFAADEFRQMGLKPVNENSYFQELYLDVNEIKDPGKLVSYHLIINKKNRYDTVSVEYKVLEDFAPAGYSGSGEIKTKTVFAGYGINCPENGFNDFESIDIKNKTVIFFYGSPPVKDIDWKGKNSTYEKIKYCINNGAKSALIVRNPLGTISNRRTENFPVFYISSDVFKNFLAGTGWRIEQIKDQIKESKKPVAFNLKTEVHIKIKTVLNKNRKTVNVLGLLEGNDDILKEEVVVVGAHLDHIGRWGDLIFHGANDNGSGSAIVMEIAEAFANADFEIKRSLLFILFTGEEMGLIGSRYYVDNPLFELKKTVAMINMDVAGSGSDGIMIVGAKDFLSFNNIFRIYNKKLVHHILKERPLSHNSDHWPFADKGVPSVFLYSMGGKSPYHHPNDIPEYLNPEVMESIGKLVFFVTVDLANRENINLK